MATIITTPAQIPVDGKATPPSSQVTPYYCEIGSDLYQVLYSSQGTSPENSLRILKRAAADINGAWVEKDATHSPDQGNQSGSLTVSVKSTTISIAYLQTGNLNLRVVTFDTTTDLWGSPGPIFVLPATTAKFVFVQRSDNTYVVVGAWAFRIYYITYAAGTWSSLVNVLTSGGAMVQGVIDSSDRIWFLINTVSTTVLCYRLSATYVLSASLTSLSIAYFGPPYFYSGYPTIILWGTTAIAIAYLSTPLVSVAVHVKIATSLTTPVFTDYTIYTPVAGEQVTYYQLATGQDGSLNLFLIDANFSIPINQILQSVFDGASAWSTSVFYDVLGNAPINGVTSGQVMQGLQALDVPETGWTATIAAITNDIANPPATFNTAEFMEVGSETPSDTITCQIIIAPPPGPPGPGPAGRPRTLRYQIPQRRWFPHTYND